jgi:hypothetical protein
VELSADPVDGAMVLGVSVGSLPASRRIRMLFAGGSAVAFNDEGPEQEWVDYVVHP